MFKIYVIFLDIINSVLFWKKIYIKMTKQGQLNPFSEFFKHSCSISGEGVCYIMAGRNAGTEICSWAVRSSSLYSQVSPQFGLCKGYICALSSLMPDVAPHLLLTVSLEGLEGLPTAIEPLAAWQYRAHWATFAWHKEVPLTLPGPSHNWRNEPS